jgi:hypothetical protein
VTDNQDTLLENVEERVTAALKGWFTPGGSEEDLLSDFLTVHKEHLEGGGDHDMPVQRSTTNKILLAAITELNRQHTQLAEVLKLRFIDKETLWAVGNRMALSEQSVSRLQKKAIEQLSFIIASREKAERNMLAQGMEAALPAATYTRLFGVAEAEQHILSLLQDSAAAAVIAVIGLGGIGKTALTDLVVRHCIRRFMFHRVIWLRIEHQTLSGRAQDPALTFENLLNSLVQNIWPDQTESLSPQQRLVRLHQELESQPYLIIIDNLEYESESDYIIDQLHGFARPTKFLLTSRTRLSNKSAVYSLQLPELSKPDALAFIRYHAQECGIAEAAEAPDADIAPIYEAAGGNPLALKLVISLLDVLPLSEILADLTRTSTNPIQDMYTHVYHKAWRALSEDGRTLLQAMPLVSESGATADYLMTVSGLSREQLWPAIHELHGRSLIEVRGSILEKRYGIHRLTNAFLCTEIIQMPGWL